MKNQYIFTSSNGIKMKKFFNSLYLSLSIAGFFFPTTHGLSNGIPQRTNRDNIKLSFAPPWWMNDYDLFMDKDSDHFNTLKQYGYDTIKLWQAHIQPGFSIPFHEGTFGFKCDMNQISMRRRNSCPYYFQAIDALRASGMKVAIEMHPVNPRELYGANNCVLRGAEAAKKYGYDAAEYAWRWAYRPYLLAGGPLNSIILDGPIDKMMLAGNASQGCGFSSLEDAITATTEFLKRLTYQFKQAEESVHYTEERVKFIYLVNFPHWKFGNVSSMSSRNHDRKGDFSYVIDRMVAESKANDINLVGFEFDNPLNYSIDLRKEECNFLGFNCRKPASYTSREVGKLKAAQQKVKQHGLEFRIITITDTKHIDEGDMPVRYDAKEAQIFTNETTIYADLIRVHFGDYLHNITLQSWLNAPSYIFDRSGPKENGMFYNALQIGRRAKGGFCNNLNQFNQESGTNFTDLADAIDFYNDDQMRDKITCMPSYQKLEDGRTFCSTYYYLLEKPNVFDYTIDAMEHFRENPSLRGCIPIQESSWLTQFKYKDRYTRIFTKGFN